MITNKVYKLKKAVQVNKEIHLEAGQEIEVVMDVVYMGGYPLPPHFQHFFLNWLKNNPELFYDDTRKW